MKRQPITQAKANRIARNYSNIKALAKMIEYIHWQECDADYRSPTIHNHFSKVLQSATAIEKATSAIVMTAVGHEERGNEYIAELLNLLEFTLENMDLHVLKAYNEGLRNLDTKELLSQSA